MSIDSISLENCDKYSILRLWPLGDSHFQASSYFIFNKCIKIIIYIFLWLKYSAAFSPGNWILMVSLWMLQTWKTRFCGSCLSWNSILWRIRKIFIFSLFSESFPKWLHKFTCINIFHSIHYVNLKQLTSLGIHGSRNHMWDKFTHYNYIL